MQAKDIIHRTNYLIEEAFELLEGEFDKKNARRIYKEAVVFEKRLSKLEKEAHQAQELCNISELELEEFEYYCSVIETTAAFWNEILIYVPSTDKGYYMFIKNICASRYSYSHI